MTVIKSLTMKCDRCSSVSDDAHSSLIELNMHRMSEGWTTSGRDLCPECNGNDVKYWTFPTQEES